MSHRPLAIVSALTIGDYLLWNWSLNANHDVLALVSGLTLPPLTIAGAWLLALTGARLIARTSRDGRRTRSRAQPSAMTAPASRRPRRASRRPPRAPVVDQAPPATSATPSRPSRKIAA